MATGYYNAGDVDGARWLPSAKPFPTEEAMLQQWAGGALTGVLCADDPGLGATRQAVTVDTYVVALDKAITDGKFAGRRCAASPEQRDALAGLLGPDRPADLKLLTQQQYLEAQACVDVYVTAVTQPSQFLDALGQPVYVKDLDWGPTTPRLQVQGLVNTLNTSAVRAPNVRLSLWQR